MRRKKFITIGKRRFALLVTGALLLISCVLLAPIGSNRAQAAEPDEETAAYIDEERAELQTLADEQQILALIYLCDETQLRTEPSADSETILTVPVGQTVLIEDAAVAFTDEENTEWQLWLYVSLYDNDTEYSGYVLSDYVVSSDERYQQWLEDSGLEPASQIPMVGSSGEVSYADIEQFPASYQEALRALKDAHPNWVFVPMETELDWNTVIANEMENGKSLVYYTLADCMKNGAYSSKWYYASEAALAYYMDPRNGLTEEGIFQFEQLTYNESYHSAEAVETFLNNTFMNSSQYAPGTEKTFATIFNEVGQTQNVSPFHLASRVYQEQGQGTSALISGTYSGYEGYYNYFNINASGETDAEVIVSGLKYAQSKGWSNAELSISGGAAVISQNYIARGQDTVYLQKFNMTSNNTYGHQYMQNITAPTTEASSTRKLYESAGAIDSTFVFKIPIYENMPDSACAKPTESLTEPTESLNATLQMVDGCWCYCVNGVVDTSYTGMACNDYGWWYVTNGVLDWGYTGMASNEYGWWYITNGALDLTYNGMACNEYGWWYYTNGALDWGYTGMACNDYGWWYITNGALDWGYTGMACNDYGWWYITNGALDLTYNGIACNEYGWWYYTNGALDWSYTGMACNDCGWWYITGGALDRSYTGLACNAYGWWYMKDGALDWNYTGMALNDYGWWYVTNGALDWSYTGIGYNEYGAWQFVNGILTGAAG